MYLDKVNVKIINTTDLIKVSLTDNVSIKTTIQDNETIVAKVKDYSVIVISDADKYTGETIITPKAHEAIVLYTKNKLVENNITVKKIPYYEVDNEVGITCIIGE